MEKRQYFFTTRLLFFYELSFENKWADIQEWVKVEGVFVEAGVKLGVKGFAFGKEVEKQGGLREAGGKTTGR